MPCSICGENMIGDGYTSVHHCPNADVPEDTECDAGPIECVWDEEEGDDETLKTKKTAQ